MWYKNEGGGITGRITINKPEPIKVYNSFKGAEVDGVHLEELHTENKTYKSQLAFFRYIVKEYYTNKRYKWERVTDEPESNIIIIEGKDTAAKTSYG